MDIRELRYFLTVARSGSFTAASEQLHVSQPALGMRIRSLEDRLGLQLFERKSRGIKLTRAGEELLVHAEAVLGSLKMAEQAMVRYRTRISEKLTIGVPPTPGKAMLPQFLEHCVGEESVRITVVEGLSLTLYDMLCEGKLDLALCYDPPANFSLRTEPLYREDLVLVGPTDLMKSDRAPLPFARLSEFPLILDSPQQITRQLIDELARSRNVTLNVVMETDSLSLKREFLLAHRAFSVVPLGLFNDAIKTNQLAWRSVRSPQILRTLSLLGRQGLPPVDFSFVHEQLSAIATEKIREKNLGWRSVTS